MTIDPQTAEKEFERFVDLMDLDVDMSGMSTEDRQDFAQQKRRILKAIECGSLIINDNGEPVFTPKRTSDANSLTFHEPTGASLAAMDRTKKDHDITKLYTTMADMTRSTPATFAMMKMPDLQVCMSITTIFLA
jgi:hypothetical protein